MLDVAVEQKPAWHLHGTVDVAVVAPGVALVDHAKLQRAIVQALLAGLSGGQVEAPAVQAGLHFVLVQVGHHPLVALGCPVKVLGLRLFFEIAIQNNLIAFFISIEPMQHKGGCGLKPADVLRLPPPGNDGKTRRLVGMELDHMLALLEQFRVPVEGKVIEDGVMLCEAHVVREPRPR